MNFALCLSIMSLNTFQMPFSSCLMFFSFIIMSMAYSASRALSMDLFSSLLASFSKKLWKLVEIKEVRPDERKAKMLT